MLRLTKAIREKLLQQNEGFTRSTYYDSKNFEEKRIYKIIDGVLHIHEEGKTSWADSRYNRDRIADDEETHRFLKKFFAEYVQTHTNEVAALNIVCTRPKELTREALKNLRLLLDRETIFKQSYVSDYTSAGYNIRIYSEEYYFPVNHDGVFGIMMIGYMYDADKEPKYEEDFWNVFVPAIKLNGTEQTASESGATKEEEVPAGELSVEKDIIYEENDVVISVDGIQKGNTSTSVSFVIENNSDNDYNVDAHSWDINGIMIGDNQYGFNSVETAAGKKSRLNLEVDNSVLESKGINYISEIDVLFWFYGDSMKQWDSGLLNIKTSQYSEELRATVDRDPDYADDVVEVWYAGNDSKNNYTFWVHNKSSYNAECTIENCSVNDWSYELTEYTFDAYGVLVNSNAYVAITIPIDKEFAKTNGIEKIENIEFDVLLEDNNWNLKGDLWKHKSDKITFSGF